MIPRPGSKAPAFTLPASDGSTFDLEGAAASGPLVLFFYPRADTPGCTKEACGFRDAIAGYRKLDVPVFGISPDPLKKVQRFAKKYDLNFPLLADEDHAVAERYGLWQQKTFMGRKYMGVLRTTFIINKGGRIAHVFENVKPDGHDAEVLAWLREHG